MAKKSTKSIPELLVDSALTLAAQKPWKYITLREIAGDAKIDLIALRDFIDDKSDILVFYGKRIDRLTLTACKDIDMSEPARDRIFEILMERFDILNQDRTALLSILHSIKQDPKSLILSLPHLKKSMAWMLEAADISTSGWSGAGKIIGITAVYANTLRAWIKDDSEDLSKTMAALDQSLDKFEKLQGLCSRL